ncbi:hypothetical protein SY88_19655 [Clostridiales bacterium PH28_bin88]|nr:hypothetical protein SY88_19655 [Clostridiales bacterium PH28_bin88]
MVKRTGEKYDAIIDAAVRVFAETGYHRAQVSRIAREAGVADGTVYLYFESKEDILISLFQTKMGEFIETIRSEIEGLEDVGEKLSRVVSGHFRQLGNHRELAMVTQIELRQADPGIAQGISQPMKQYFELIEDLVREGQVKGQVPADVDARLARKMIFGTMDEVVTSWVMSSRIYALEGLSEPVFRLLARGLLQAKTGE